MKHLQLDHDFTYYQDSWGFYESFVNLRGDTFIYTAFGSIKAPDTLRELYEIPTTNKKRKLIQFLREYSNYHLNYTEFDCIENVICEIFDMYDIKTIKDFVQDLVSFGIEVERKFERYVTRGYSQGDAYEIFIPHTLAKEFGIEVSELLDKGMMKQIDNLCWDSEIGGTFNISFEYEVKRETFGDSVTMEFDNEFDYNEWCMNTYDFSLDIDSIIKYIDRKTNEALSQEDLQEIRERLEALDYTDVKY